MIPPRRVLAATDFSAPSAVALTFAARLAAHCRGELHVVHVQDPLLTTAAEARGFDLVDETRHELEHFVRGAGLHAREIHLHVVTGAAAAAVCDVGSRERTDVIVVGAHGMSGAEHAVFGSVAEGVIRRANTSVLVVPPAWTAPRPDRPDLSGIGPVVAATDLCTPSAQAAAAGCDLAVALHTRVELVHVVPDLPVLARWKAHAERALAARVASVHEQMRTLERALHASVPVEIRVEQGRLADRLAAVAAPTADRQPLLVLGRRAEASRSGSPGSTAYRVLMLAEVPVLVYLPPE
jgi:nucleotide-binding universal stress UspA family protein